MHCLCIPPPTPVSFVVFFTCCFDIVSSFGFAHQPRRRNNTPRPHPDTATVVPRDQKSSAFHVTACHGFTEDARVNRTRRSAFPRIISAVGKEEIDDTNKEEGDGEQTKQETTIYCNSPHWDHLLYFISQTKPVHVRGRLLQV